MADKQHWLDLLLQHAVPETVARSCIRDVADEAQLVAKIKALESPGVERLLQVFSATGARTHWREMGLATTDEAQGVVAWLLRRRWAMTALRENARLKLERLAHVGVGASGAAARRSAFAHAADSRRAACSYWQGPRLFSGHDDF